MAIDSAQFRVTSSLITGFVGQQISGRGADFERVAARFW
jgi:hypothetical protein